ncbi:hypothetical protein [Massilia cavernae]|uniref:Uncharacterized protein n=1 Tax=Massilia cavernae TaxID=2320864 RepID=A0A418XSX1_9BURK|nr:hypothetical protein [Massilia cavernae]RJG15546.1 hypothetical protein D3872_13115 [Massilia cavernae]
MDEQDPKRKNMQPPIPSHLPDQAPKEDEEKIAGTDQVPGHGPHDKPLAGSPGLASGPKMDNVGGAGLGKAPGDGDSTTRDRDTKVDQKP